MSPTSAWRRTKPGLLGWPVMTLRRRSPNLTSYGVWPIFLVHTVLRQERQGQTFITEADATSVGWGSGGLDVKGAAEEVLVIIDGPHSQFSTVIWQWRQQFELQIETLLI